MFGSQVSIKMQGTY